MRSIFLILALVWAEVAMAAASHPSLPPPVIPDALGVQVELSDLRRGDLEKIAGVGFKWVRVEVRWADSEPKKGEYDFSRYDSLVDTLARLKMRAVLVLNGGNPLYAAAGDKAPFVSQIATPEFRNAFVNWTVAAVGHFRARGYLWEIWDEPNRNDFEKSEAGALQYAALVTAAGEALRAAELIGPKGEALLGPSVATVDLPFLETCFRQGLLEYWDGVSVHPVRDDAPETVEEEFRRVRMLIHRYAPVEKSIPVVSSHWGYSSVSPQLGAEEPARRETQAKYLTRQFLANMANDVALSIWPRWRDAGEGLVMDAPGGRSEPAQAIKPAYAAMKTLQEQLGGFRFNKRLFPWKGSEDFTLVFQKGEEVRVAAWTLRAEPQPIGIPASPGAYNKVLGDGGLATMSAVEQERGPFGFKTLPSSQVTYFTFQGPNELLRSVASLNRLPLEWIYPVPGQAPPLRLRFTNYSAQDLYTRLISSKERKETQWAIMDGKKDRQRAAARSTVDTVIAGELLKAAPEGVDLMLGVELAYSPNVEGDDSLAFPQRVRLIPSNPLEVTRLPGKPDEIVLQIVNPSGVAWNGHIATTSERRGGKGGWGGGMLTNPVTINLSEKVPMTLVRLPFERGSKGPWWTGLNGVILRSAAGLDATFPIPDHRFFDLDLPNIQVVSDGDPKAKVITAHREALPAEGAVVEGLPALNVRYEFQGGWKCLRIVNPSWPPPSEKNLLGEPKEFAIWLYGDGQGCMAHMRFVDASGQFFQTPGTKIDWKGWRQVKFPMSHQSKAKFESWGGNDNGQIQYPIDLDSVFVLDNVSREPLKGEIYVAGPSLIF